MGSSSYLAILFSGREEKKKRKKKKERKAKQNQETQVKKYWGKLKK